MITKTNKCIAAFVIASLIASVFSYYGPEKAFLWSRMFTILATFATVLFVAINFLKPKNGWWLALDFLLMGILIPICLATFGFFAEHMSQAISEKISPGEAMFGAVVSGVKTVVGFKKAAIVVGELFETAGKESATLLLDGSAPHWIVSAILSVVIAIALFVIFNKAQKEFQTQEVDGVRSRGVRQTP